MVVVTPVDGVDAAFAAVNVSRFGLQAGIFTHDLSIAFRAHHQLEMGG
ncbi:MAG TPA: aldehyde dehydrogenase family protein [Jiangellaceae bacterium]|nr:aldehyde dehydrogenase family protein [Jiangellaceae bacterium]